MNKLPRVRTTNIVTLESGKELLVYDLGEHKAFQFNETVSLIWQNCDGQKSVEEFIFEQQMPEEFVLAGIERLRKENLLVDNAELFPKEKISRRKLIVAASATAIALPIITALVAPTAAHAQSACAPNGQDVCIATQANISDCLSAISPLESTRCCGGTFTVITYDNPLGSNSCCGTCGPRIG